MNIWTIDRILCGAVVSVLVYILMYKARNWLSPSRYSVSLLIGGILALVLTWYLLFWFMTLTTGRLLAPWDQWASFAPPKNTWQHQLNDFFSQDSSQYLIALVIVGISGILFLAGMFRDANDVRDKLPLAFAITNLAFLLTSSVSIALVTRLPDLWLPQPRPSVDIGYHHTWPDILTTSVLLGLLFWVQRRIVTPSFWKQSAMHTGGDE